MRPALATIPDLNFEVVKEYLATGDSSALTEEHMRMIKICRDCWAVMAKYPQRNILIHHIMELEGLQYKEAAKYVDFTRNTWGSILDINQQFCETFFLNQLMKEISNPNAKASDKAKNLATLQKHLQNMPPPDIDPALMESNTIVLQFNLGEKNFQIPQEVIRHLPKSVQEQLFAGIGNDITDAEAEDIIDS